MKISELQARQGKVDLVAEVVEKEEPRSFEKFGKSGKVCNAKLKDETGEVKLTLWNEEVDMVNVGDKVQITNGYVNEWQGELQLSAGKFGKMEVIKGDAPATAAEPQPEAAPEPQAEPKPEGEPVPLDDIPDEHLEVDEEDIV